MPNTQLAVPRIASAERRGTATYSTLLSQIRKTIGAGKRRAQAAVEREKVRTSWEIGKLILDHVLTKEEAVVGASAPARAGYGAKVIKRLSRDLGMSHSELGRMVEFARTYPIYAAPRKLSWSHYRELLSVNDAEKRKAIAAQAEKEDWSQTQLRKEIRKIGQAQKAVSADAKVTLNAPKPGKTGLYRVIDWLGVKAYDLGFSIRYQIKGKLPKVNASAPQDLYHYEAKVLSVSDGDTFHAAIDLGFGITLEQRLRLRALDARELPSRDGEQAKELLEKVLGLSRSQKTENRRQKSPDALSADVRHLSTIVIRTSKDDDQYGRYLVDVFINNVHIDQELLASGLFTVRG